MVKKHFLLTAGFCVSLGTGFCVSAENEIFRSISDDGTVEYSDRRTTSGSSEKFTVSKPVIVTGPSISNDPDSYLESVERDEQKNATSTSEFAYTDFRILSPAQSDGGWIDGDVQVKLSLTPELKAGHEVVVELNGAVVAAGQQTKLALPEVYRGLHTLLVSVRDVTSGATLTSDSIDFQVHRHSEITDTSMLHPSLQTDTTTNPSNIEEILSE